MADTQESCRHELCKRSAQFMASAIYAAPDRSELKIREVKAYPMPMTYACITHLPHVLALDMCSPGAPEGYLVEVVR